MAMFGTYSDDSYRVNYKNLESGFVSHQFGISLGLFLW